MYTCYNVGRQGLSDSIGSLTGIFFSISFTSFSFNRLDLHVYL